MACFCVLWHRLISTLWHDLVLMLRQGMKSTVAVPESIPGLVSKELLVMTFMEGEQITRLQVTVDVDL